MKDENKEKPRVSKVISPETLLLDTGTRPCGGCDGNFCIAEGGDCTRDE